ncbi:MAG: acetyl-CoA C-acyltransferase, partial [Planctomycetota bacterium]|nr:acetyl-CoA C-acyltransferase [Planctomycetota bacterium]
RLFFAPIDAIRHVVAKGGLTLDQIDLFEINEAFASQTVACVRGLNIDPAKVNVNGGAVALGHPIGASGARVLTTLLWALHARQARYGVASLCLGGGNAVALLVEMA